VVPPKPSSERPHLRSLDAKCRLTLPRRVLDHLDLAAGDLVELEVLDDHVRLHKVRAVRQNPGQAARRS